MSPQMLHKIFRVAKRKYFQWLLGIGEKRDQKHFVLSHIEKAPVKRQTLQAKTKRSGSFKYFFYSENSRVQVCRLFFLNTVSIKQDFIYETFNQQVQPGVIRPSKSGKTNNKKLPDVVLQGIRNISILTHAWNHIIVGH